MLYLFKNIIFQSYGHDNVSVVDGGFAQWQKAGYEISQEDVKPGKGNWTAKDLVSKYNVSFDDFTITKKEKEEILEKTDEVCLYVAHPYSSIL